MGLETYEDFLNLKQLSDFLSVRGLSTSGVKVELVACAFTAIELKFDIIESAEAQKEKLEKTYSELLKRLDIPDPNTTSKKERTDDITSYKRS